MEEFWGAVIPGDTIGGKAGRVVFEGPVHIASDVQIKIAVAVEVGPCCGGTPGGTANPCCCCFIKERAVTLISKIQDTAVPRDQQVGEAVVIGISNGQPMVIQADVCKACCECLIAEVTVAVAEYKDRFADGLLSLEAATTGNQGVRQSIAIKVCCRGPGSEGFKDCGVTGFFSATRNDFRKAVCSQRREANACRVASNVVSTVRSQRICDSRRVLRRRYCCCCCCCCAVSSGAAGWLGLQPCRPGCRQSVMSSKAACSRGALLCLTDDSV